MIRLGEPVFLSVQGEGNRAGVLSVWVRFAGCNLRCPGFMQPNPKDPSTYKKIPDCFSVKSLSDLPVLEVGCDSLYSVDPKFKHLWTSYNEPEELMLDVQKLLPHGSWRHPITKNNIDLCFTGGEPMLFQKHILDILETFWGACSVPNTVQIETNGTQKLTSGFADSRNWPVISWNISPKLYSVSGEFNSIDHDVIESYFKLSYNGCLKFVVNGTDECWEELRIIRQGLPNVPIYVMPVGSSHHDQTNSEVLGEIASIAISEGYHVSGRLQSVLWKNGVGT